jgi:hypothetical protein
MHGCRIVVGIIDILAVITVIVLVLFLSKSFTFGSCIICFIGFGLGAGAAALLPAPDTSGFVGLLFFFEAKQGPAVNSRSSSSSSLSLLFFALSLSPQRVSAERTYLRSSFRSFVCLFVWANHTTTNVTVTVTRGNARLLASRETQ